MANGIKPCKACGGDGFKYQRCSCREASCPHESAFGYGDGTDPEPGIYFKFWVRRTDGSSQPGGKHEECEYFVLDWEHDKFAPFAARAYAAACEQEYPELAKDLRRRADDAQGIKP